MVSIDFILYDCFGTGGPAESKHSLRENRFLQELLPTSVELEWTWRVLCTECALCADTFELLFSFTYSSYFLCYVVSICLHKDDTRRICSWENLISWWWNVLLPQDSARQESLQLPQMSVTSCSALLLTVWESSDVLWLFNVRHGGRGWVLLMLKSEITQEFWGIMPGK